MSDDLASAVIGDPNAQPQDLAMRRGVVTQINPLLVRVGSAITAQPCRALASYTGRAGDTVSVLEVPGDRLVLGRTRPMGEPAYLAAHGNTGTTSGTTPAVLTQVLTQAQGVSGFFFVLADALLTFTGGPAVYEFSIMVDATEYGNARINTALSDGNISKSAYIPHDGVNLTTIALKLTRTSGTGTASFFGTDLRYMNLHTIFCPE